MIRWQWKYFIQVQEVILKSTVQCAIICVCISHLWKPHRAFVLPYNVGMQLIHLQTMRYLFSVSIHPNMIQWQRKYFIQVQEVILKSTGQCAMICTCISCIRAPHRALVLPYTVDEVGRRLLTGESPNTDMRRSAHHCILRSRTSFGSNSFAAMGTMH